jgi:phosphatidylglycerophosphate synthase
MQGVRNFRIADVFTVPNAISAVGLGLVLKGSARADTGWGIGLTVAGRLLDLLDGKVARMMNQSSQFGAGVDAAFDKAGVLAIGVNEWRYRIAPRPALLAIAAQNAVNLTATAISARLGGDDELAPVHDGKRAMGYQNAALGAYAVAALLRRRGVPTGALTFGLTGHANLVVGVGYYGIRASRQYVVQMRQLLRGRGRPATPPD